MNFNDEFRFNLNSPSLSETQRMIAKDSILPKDIQVERPSSETNLSQVKIILLTGATGFLGSHVLKELLEGYPGLEKIYCLIRGDNPKQRLLDVLNKNKLHDIQNFSKVIAISGDFVVKRLNLDDGIYSSLAKEVEAIFHFGCKVAHKEHYKINENSKAVRNVNVGGLLNILRFASKSKTKHVFNGSSLLTPNNVNEDGSLSESWPDLRSLQLHTNSGYVVSKLVCDLLLKQATEERGIPCRSFRYSELRGSSTTGKSFAEQSHLINVLIFWMTEGISPSLPLPFLVTRVDLAAKLTLKVSFNDKADHGVYNVSHPRPDFIQDVFAKMALEMGYTVTNVSFSAYRSLLLRKCRTAKSLKNVPILFKMRKMYEDENLSGSFVDWSYEAYRNIQKNKDFYVSKKMMEFAKDLYCGMEPSWKIIQKDLYAARNEGYFNLFEAEEIHDLDLRSKI